MMTDCHISYYTLAMKKNNNLDNHVYKPVADWDSYKRDEDKVWQLLALIILAILVGVIAYAYWNKFI